MKKIAAWLTLAVVFVVFSFSSEDDMGPDSPEWSDPPPKQYAEPEGGWVYAKLEYRHDVLEPNCYFMKLLAHPKSEVPDVIGAYAFTDVGVQIKLRGIDAPRALQKAEQLHRPHEWRRRERERWNDAMRYVWEVSNQTKTFRVHNLEKLDETTVEADMEYLLGGEWRDLAISLVKDEYVRPLGIETPWDAGNREYGLLSPEVPK